MPSKDQRLHAMTIPELEALIDNWMLAAGSMHYGPTLDYVTSKIREAEAILQEKRAKVED